YTNAYTFPDTEEPNTTRETRPNYIKWRAWIATNTPLPTPPTAPYASVIGLFQGAHYHVTNWYRPKLDCTMNHNSAPFCEVCSEAMVLAFYQHVHPVDGYSPSTTNVSVTNATLMPFSVTPLQPVTHVLGIQWFTNGVALSGATNSSFVLTPQLLSN